VFDSPPAPLPRYTLYVRLAPVTGAAQVSATAESPPVALSCCGAPGGLGELAAQARSASYPLPSTYCASQVRPPVKLVAQAAEAEEALPRPATHTGELVIGYNAVNYAAHASAYPPAVLVL